jgi:hypothetical protein
MSHPLIVLAASWMLIMAENVFAVPQPDGVFDADHDAAHHAPSQKAHIRTGS